MAKRTKKAVNKSAFVRDFITANPEANRRAVEEAWLAAGHEGVISSALVSNLRAKLGLTGNLPKESEAGAKSDTTSAPALKKPGKPKGATGKLRAESLNMQRPRPTGNRRPRGWWQEPHSKRR